MVMQLIPLTLAFILGVVFGVGACVLYFNHKVNEQMGMMEEHMEDIDEMMSEEMMGSLPEEEEED